jgi:hypothetical protein
MDPRNRAFLSVVKHERNKFIELMEQCKLLHQIYPSKHFFERVVERNLEAVDVMRMLIPVIKEFRGTTYNVRSYCVQWKQWRLFANITVAPVSGRRQITLKTMYDRDVDAADFDVVVTI